MTKSESILFKAKTFTDQLEKVEKSKQSPTLQNYLLFTKEVQAYIYEQTQSNTVDKALVQKADIIEAIQILKYAFYSFFPTLKDEAAQSMIAVWYKYLKKYKKIVLADAIDGLVTTPGEYAKAPNLPDVVYMCESLRFDEKYK